MVAVCSPVFETTFARSSKDKKGVLRAYELLDQQKDSWLQSERSASVIVRSSQDLSGCGFPGIPAQRERLPKIAKRGPDEKVLLLS